MSQSHICPDIDFVFLQDLSGSYADDLPILKSQIANIIATVEDMNQNADFGVASFIDKPTGGFAQPDEYVYQTNLAITSDNDAVVAAVNSLTTYSGLDVKEAQLEALMHAALRVPEVGYRADTLRIVMVSTDAAFHVAGDFGTAPANNGDAILDGGGIGEDYPSIAQAAAALAGSGVFPVFSVTAAEKAVYQGLVDDLGTGAVVVMSANSSDFADAVRMAVAKACGHVTHEGTEIEDEIDGTEFEDGIFGIGGDDTLRGHDGNDLVDGGSGNDVLRGNRGRDDVNGGTGMDTLSGGGGNDTIKGGQGDDLLSGGFGRDMFIVNAGDGADTIRDFENGRDKIDLSSFHRHEGVSAVLDAIEVAGEVQMTLPSGTSIILKGMTLAELGLEDVILNPVGDGPVAVNDVASVVAGKTVKIDVVANDVDIDGDAMSVQSVGAAAHGTVSITTGGLVKYIADEGFRGGDTFTYTITDGTFTDTASVSVTVLPNLIGDAGDNLLIGGSGPDLVVGKGGNDTMSGVGGDDTLSGGRGNDDLSGGLGRDLIKGGAGDDNIKGGAAGGFDTPENDTIFGGAGNDTISGDWSDDLIDGGLGRDSIHGDEGDDQITGGAGNDYLSGGTENDEIFGGAGRDWILGDSGNDQLRGDFGRDTIEGGAGADQIYGSGGNGANGSDDDVLTGGAGADVFIFDLALDANKNGDDIITDFDITLDQIRLDGDVLVQLGDTAQGALIEQQTGGSILVESVLVDDLRPLIVGLVEIA